MVARRVASAVPVGRDVSRRCTSMGRKDSVDALVPIENATGLTLVVEIPARGLECGSTELAVASRAANCVEAFVDCLRECRSGNGDSRKREYKCFHLSTPPIHCKKKQL